MEKIARGKRASEAQKEYLINFLEENVDLANDKFCAVDGAKYREDKWKEMAGNLNALGGTKKDGPDLRQHTRSKYMLIKKEEKRSGINGLRKMKQLSEIEERIINITSTEAVDGDETQEMGLQSIQEESTNNDTNGFCISENMMEILTEDVEDTTENIEILENTSLSMITNQRKSK
ncbi:uncharacterized protein [Musca autumnalis]|uniref:uncharacterized protein n=1 Tax=Musca autumnalis TaxID=221902 RepID=UPI003CED81B5